MSSTSLVPARALDVETVTDTAGFAALEQEWDALHRAADGTPYQSWAWLYSWWESADRDGLQLRIVTMRDPGSGTLVGVVPLMVKRRNRLRSLMFLVDSEPQDILALEDRGAVVEREFARTLAAAKGYDVADLGEVEDGARLWSVYRAWGWARESTVVARTSHVAVAPEDEVLAGLSRNRRATLRKSLRRAAALGLEAVPATAERLVEATSTMVALHRDTWDGRGIAPSHTTERYERFLTLAVPRLAARGLADVLEWSCDDRVEISQMLLYGRGVAQAYQEGARRDARDQLQWGSLCIWESLAAARSHGCAVLDLSPGEEPHKASWNPVRVAHHRIRLGRGAVRGRLAFGFLALRKVR